MLDIIAEVERTKNAGFYFVALLGALSIPDIAGALGSPDGIATRPLYEQWFNTHIASKYVVRGQQSLTGRDCYYFRCSMLHQGTAQLQNSKAGLDRIFYVEPGHGVILHNNLVNTGNTKVLNIDAGQFVQDIVDAARAWHATVVSTTLYQANVAKCVIRHPNGLPPYVLGVPCIG